MGVMLVCQCSSCGRTMRTALTNVSEYNEYIEYNSIIGHVCYRCKKKQELLECRQVWWIRFLKWLVS